MMKMKKLISTLLILFVALTTVSAQTDVVVQETNFYRGNWFIGAGGGALIYFGNGDTHGDLSKRVAPAINVSLGKWVSPNVALRAEYVGFQARGFTSDSELYSAYGNANSQGYYRDKWKLSTFHADVMVNAMNLLGGYRESRLYTLSPYVGFGVMRNGDTKVEEFAFTAGLHNSFTVSPLFDINLDVKGGLVKDPLDGQYGGRVAEGFVAVTAGVTYNFGRGSSKSSGTVVAATFYDTPSNDSGLEQEIESVKAENRMLKNELASANDKLSRKPKVVKESEVSSNIVFFEIGSSKLSERSRVILSLAAKAIKEDSSDKVFTIVGYADNTTGSVERNKQLSEARAEAVYAAMVNEFGVSSSKLKVNYKGGVSDMFYNNPSLSRVVIMD